MAGDSIPRSLRKAFPTSPKVAPMAGFGALFVAVCFVFSVIPLSTFFPDYSLPSLTVKSNQPSLALKVQNDLYLDPRKCQAEFSRFYPQLEENEKIWRVKGGIKYTDLQNAAQNCRHGCVHLVIKHGQIFIRGQVKDWQSRVRSSLQLLEKAYSGANDEEKQVIEGTEMVISTADFDGFTDPKGSRGAGWVLDKRVNDKEGQYLFPDFSFASWPEAGIPSYEEFRRQAEKVNDETPWEAKLDPAFWRGDALLGHGIKARDSLLTVASSGPNVDAWSDVKRTSFWESGPDIGKIVSPPEHCRHKFLIHSEGVAYSGRSKFIMGCQSTVIMHKLEWTQHFHPAFVSSSDSKDQNTIVLPGEYFETLPSTVQSLIGEETRASNAAKSTLFGAIRPLTTGQKIAQNAKRTLTDRYLTPAATACYIRAALVSYAKMMDRSTWPNPEGAVVMPGGGVKPGAGTAKGSLKELGVHGDVEVGVWGNLGQPEWPPQ